MKKCVYLQIVDRVRRDCEHGLYGEGGKLPSCRELALQLGVNPNTVQRAYSQLESEGVIVASPKKGYFAALSADRSRERAAEEKLANLRSAGFTREQLIAMIDKLYDTNKKKDEDEL